jgi:hypothetical protein
VAFKIQDKVKILILKRITLIQKQTQSGIIAGKLNGVIPATTPNGVLMVIVSMSLAMFGIVSPSCNDVILQQCSTTSVNCIYT